VVNGLNLDISMVLWRFERRIRIVGSVAAAEDDVCLERFVRVMGEGKSSSMSGVGAFDIRVHFAWGVNIMN
jgi:hypothetical protein